MFERVNAERSAVMFLALEDDADALMESINIKQRYPNADLVVSLKQSKLKATFKAAGVTYVVARNEIVSKLVASYIFEPDVADLNLDLISSAGLDTDYDIQEYEVLSTNQYVNRDCHDVFHAIKKDHDVVLMGLSKIIYGKRKLIANPGREVTVEEGDYLVVMTSGASKQKLKNAFGVVEGRMD